LQQAIAVFSRWLFLLFDALNCSHTIRSNT